MSAATRAEFQVSSPRLKVAGFTIRRWKRGGGEIGIEVKSKNENKIKSKSKIRIESARGRQPWEAARLQGVTAGLSEIKSPTVCGRGVPGMGMERAKWTACCSN